MHWILQQPAVNIEIKTPVKCLQSDILKRNDELFSPWNANSPGYKNLFPSASQLIILFSSPPTPLHSFHSKQTLIR